MGEILGVIPNIHTRGSAKVTRKGGVAEVFFLYTFSDSSTMIIKWQAESVLEEGKKLKTMSGTGNYVSGAGRFEGIKGDMILKGRYITPYSVERGMLGDMVVDVISSHTTSSK